MLSAITLPDDYAFPNVPVITHEEFFNFSISFQCLRVNLEWCRCREGIQILIVCEAGQGDVIISRPPKFPESWPSQTNIFEKDATKTHVSLFVDTIWSSVRSNDLFALATNKFIFKIDVQQQ